MLFPDEGSGGRGALVNVSGAGVRRPRPTGKRRSVWSKTRRARAQQIFAVGNMEHPVVDDAPVHPTLAASGPFREYRLHAARRAANAAEALRTMQRAGWR